MNVPSELNHQGVRTDCQPLESEASKVRVLWNVKLVATGFGYKTFGGTTTDACAVNPEAVAEDDGRIRMPVRRQCSGIVQPVATAGLELCHTAVVALTDPSEKVPTALTPEGLVVNTTKGDTVKETRVGGGA